MTLSTTGSKLDEHISAWPKLCRTKGDQVSFFDYEHEDWQGKIFFQVHRHRDNNGVDRVYTKSRKQTF